MVERRFRLERQDQGQWWFLGSFCDIRAAINMMRFYDPEGTIMRVWDTERNETVRWLASFASCLRRKRKRKKHDRSLDWRKYGF